jgi:hypothetical protein
VLPSSQEPSEVQSYPNTVSASRRDDTQAISENAAANSETFRDVFLTRGKAIPVTGRGGP